MLLKKITKLSAFLFIALILIFLSNFNFFQNKKVIFFAMEEVSSNFEVFGYQKEPDLEILTKAYDKKFNKLKQYKNKKIKESIINYFNTNFEFDKNFILKHENFKINYQKNKKTKKQLIKKIDNQKKIKVNDYKLNKAIFKKMMPLKLKKAIVKTEDQCKINLKTEFLKTSMDSSLELLGLLVVSGIISISCLVMILKNKKK